MKKIEFKQGYVLVGDAVQALQGIETESIQTCITSPPYYGLRSYCGDELQQLEIGREESPKEYISNLIEVFKEVYRTLKDDGILWINIGDSYAGSGQGVGSPLGEKQASNKGSKTKKSILLKVEGVRRKELIGIPWMLAFALREIGFMIRQDIIWNKPNPFPTSTRDRFCVAHEYLFMLTKKPKYKFNYEEALEEAAYAGISRGSSSNRYEQESATLAKTYDKRLKRSVWTIQPAKYKGAHFATMPTELVLPCLKTATDREDIVLDPFMGSGTVADVATRNRRRFVGIELNPDFTELATTRIRVSEISLDIVDTEEINMFE